MKSHSTIPPRSAAPGQHHLPRPNPDYPVPGSFATQSSTLNPICSTQLNSAGTPILLPRAVPQTSSLTCISAVARIYCCEPTGQRDGHRVDDATAPGAGQEKDGGSTGHDVLKTRITINRIFNNRIQKWHTTGHTVFAISSHFQQTLMHLADWRRRAY